MKKALEVVLALVIAGAVLAFGGVQPLAYSLVEVSLFLALLLLLLKLTRGQDAQLQVPLWPLLFAALVGVQVIPLPSNVVAKVSPARLLDPGVSLAHAAAGWRGFLLRNGHGTAPLRSRVTRGAITTGCR